MGILMTAGSGTPSSGTLNATIQSNVISNPGLLAVNGIHLNSGNSIGDTFQVCTNIGGAGALANTVNGSGTNTQGNTDIRVRQRQATTVRLPGYGGGSTDVAAVAVFLQGRNIVAPTASAAVQVPPGGGFTGTGTSCP